MKKIAMAFAAWTAVTTVSAAEITLFEHDNFNGRRVFSYDAIPNLGNSGFNDMASSVIVRSGTWQICDDAYFRGRCITLQPGSYPSLNQMGMNDRISSVREFGGWGPPPGPPPGPVPGPAPGYGGGGWGGGARAILYSNPDFQGQSFVIQSDYMRDFANTGFNDRAQSLRVERGYWMFCSDAFFQGTCRTFGPGSYPNLGRALNNAVSSARRISEEYPYNSNPRWPN
jgi:hypothetical protein